MDILSLFLETGFWLATVRMATPLIFGTMGELICERAGVLNLGIEGIMAAGCMSGWTWVFLGGTLWGGVLFAACVGAALGLLHAVFTVHLGLSQHVTGLGITMLGASLSSFIFRMVLPQVTTPPKIPLRAAGHPRALDPALHRPGPLQPDRPDPPGLRPRRRHGLRAAAHPPWPGPAHGRRKPARRRSPGPLRAGLRTGAVMVGSAFMAVGGAF
jgi:nucleoside ABC transporter membrane protein